MRSKRTARGRVCSPDWTRSRCAEVGPPLRDGSIPRMTITRRQLLASAAAALPAARALAWIPERPPPRTIAGAALQAAKAGGASYADVRLVRLRRQQLRTRDDHLIALSDTDSYGVGVRVLKSGTWGFAGTPDVSTQAAEKAAQRALLIAEANAVLPHRPVRLAP